IRPTKPTPPHIATSTAVINELGSSHNLVMTSLVGGIFMVWVDVLCRTLLNNQELPVGVITAAIGSVFFLFLLYFRKQSR
ncbi:MAG: iron chelate uptake ABC transporter family permease subunit, partial [Pseudomonadota bacterium]